MLDTDSIKVGDWVTFPSADGAWYQVTEIVAPIMHITNQTKFYIDKEGDPQAFLWEKSISGVRSGTPCAGCEGKVEVRWPDVDYLCKRCRAA